MCAIDSYDDFVHFHQLVCTIFLSQKRIQLWILGDPPPLYSEGCKVTCCVRRTMDFNLSKFELPRVTTLRTGRARPSWGMAYCSCKIDPSGTFKCQILAPNVYFYKKIATHSQRENCVFSLFRVFPLSMRHYIRSQ